MNRIVSVLMKRDGLSQKRAEIAILYAQIDIRNGANPFRILMNTFNLEPDYLRYLI